jgi:hypothetical protein
MTLRPAAFKARALSVTAIVGDGLMRLRCSASNAIETLQSMPLPARRPVVMRAGESSKWLIGEEIRLVQSLQAINFPVSGTSEKPRLASLPGVNGHD